MSKAAKFVAHDGTLVSFAGWRQQHRNHKHRYFKEFESGRIYAACEWRGVVRDADSIPKSHWKVFAMVVVNIISTDGEGRLLPEVRRVIDPTATREFRTEQECVDAYEDILVRYANCEWLTDKAGATVFAEKGNVLVPIPPDTPDVRGMAQDVADLADSW